MLSFIFGGGSGRGDGEKGGIGLEGGGRRKAKAERVIIWISQVGRFLHFGEGGGTRKGS